MKNLKRILAAALVLAMALTAAACHPKDEIAVTVGDVEFTSAYYMCALINADSEAKSRVQEELSDDESTTDIDYYSKKIDDKDYVTWVEDTAMDYLKKIAAYKTLCKDNELELDKEEAENAEYYASYYWSSYGYSAYFEPNGVGEKTYTQYMKDSYYSELYFEHLYGEGGEKEIAADNVKDTMYKNFIIADMLQASFSGLEDDEITETKEQFDKYAEELKAGTKTFEEVYNDYNDIDEEEEDTDTSSGSSSSSSSTESSSTESSSSDATSSEDTSSDSEEEEELEPLDSYASILGAEDTVYESEHFDTVNKMATNEIQIIELDDDAGIILVVKKDIKADPYYLENLDSTTRHLIADEEYEADIEKYAGELELTVNDYAVNQFKVKKIKEPTAS